MHITICLFALLLAAASARAAPFEWNAYGGDGNGRRYAALAGITPANVDRLALRGRSAPVSWATASGARTMR